MRHHRPFAVPSVLVLREARHAAHLPQLPLVAVLLGCGSAAPAQLPEQPVPGFEMAQAGPDCAPWDGAAVTITLSGPSASLDSIQPPYLHVSLWKDLSELSGRTWRWGAGDQVGGASLCVEGDECQGATAGIVQLGRLESDSTISGRLRLEFPGRPAVAGSFRAVWRPRDVMCG